jgi:osmoprotectant transport system substrate-binding protein
MRTPIRLLLALLATFGLVAAACGSDDSSSGDTDTTAPSGPAITIGAQDFGESAILAEIYGQALAAEGFDVSQQALGGYRDIGMAAFSSGDINFAPEYVASMLEFLNDQAGAASSDLDASLAELEAELEPLGLVALDPAPAVDTNAFVITAETSESLGITSLSDLAEKGADLRLGGPADCETNAFCLPGLQDTYGFDLSGDFTALDTGVIATALGGGEIDVAVLFSTDGRIVEEGWVLLEDDKGMLAADNVVPVVTQELFDAYGTSMTSVVNDVSAKLTTEALTEMNKQYDVDKESAADIAAGWLSDNGFS